MLPVKQRVVFKVLTTIHKSLNSSTAPAYMSELCSVYQPHRPLRSSSDQWKLVEKKSSNRYGARAINILGDQLWNDYHWNSVSLKHTTLKTLLFKREYETQTSTISRTTCVFILSSIMFQITRSFYCFIITLLLILQYL